MTKCKIQELVRAILSPVPRFSLAQARQKGLARGKLIRVDHAHRLAERHFARLFRDLERACNQTADECAGRTEAEIRARLKRRCDAVFLRYAQPFKLSSSRAMLPASRSPRNKPRQRITNL